MTEISPPHIQTYAANPTIERRATADGYWVSAIPSNSFAAKLGSVALFLMCLVFLAAGIAVWFLPDTAFDGDPQLLKIIVSAATWVVFFPVLYFNFFSITTMRAEIDLSHSMVHQIFENKHGRETKRRSFAFSEIKDLNLQTGDRIMDVHQAITWEYGQIYLKLSANKGVSLVWGNLGDLRPVWDEMRHDIFGDDR